jgi:sugar phosphate isomerase/epimerase
MGSTGGATNTGQGGIDFPKILRALKDVGYDKAVDIVIVGASITYPLSRQMGIAAEARGYLNRPSRVEIE